MTTSDEQVEQANFSYFVMDIAWFGFASAATMRFLPYFAIHMGSTPLEVGLITSLPAIVLFFVNWLSGWWHRRYTNTLHAMLVPSILHRAVFILPAFTPFFLDRWRPIWIILAVMIPSVGQGVSSTIFIVLMREAVRKERLTKLMARRKLWMSVAIGIGTIVAGFLLEVLSFPLNYQVVFLIGFAGSLMSLRYLIQIRVKSSPPPPSVSIVQLFKQQVSSPDARSVVKVTLTAFISFYFIVGVIPIHLESMGAREGFVTIFRTVELLSAALVTVLTMRLTILLGHRNLVVASVTVTAFAAVILGLAANLWVTLVSAVLTGAAWTLADIAMFGFFADHTNIDNIGATILYNEMMYIGIFIGPLLGNSLLELGMTTTSVLLIGAGFRLVGGGLIFGDKPKHKRVSAI